MQPKQPFIHVEDLKIRVKNSDEEDAVIYSINVYGFTSKFYLYTTGIILFLSGAITGVLINASTK